MILAGSKRLGRGDRHRLSTLCAKRYHLRPNSESLKDPTATNQDRQTKTKRLVWVPDGVVIPLPLSLPASTSGRPPRWQTSCGNRHATFSRLPHLNNDSIQHTPPSAQKQNCRTSSSPELARQNPSKCEDAFTSRRYVNTTGPAEAEVASLAFCPFIQTSLLGQCRVGALAHQVAPNNGSGCEAHGMQ